MCSFAASANSYASSVLSTEHKPAVILTDEESKQIEREWANSLKNHTEELTSAFEKYSPNDYCGYKKFRDKVWGPTFSKDHDKVYNYWFSLADRWSLKYARLHELFNAWANLNNASIYMECYLLYGRKEDLLQIEDKIETVLATLPSTSKQPNKRYPVIPSPFPWRYTLA